MEVSLTSSSSDRGSADDLRVAVPRSLSSSTFVLVMFSFSAQRWFVVARSPRMAALDGLGLVLEPITSQPCRVIAVECDPDDIEAIEAAALKVEPPSSNAEMREHFAPFAPWGRRKGDRSELVED